MLEIAPETSRAYEARMEKHHIPMQERGPFRKWIRFYLDFCEKYRLRARAEESLPAFLAKLKPKGQSLSQQEQAARAVQLLLSGASSNRRPAQMSTRRAGGIANPSSSGGVREEPVSDHRGQSWEREYESLQAAVRIRNYSSKTLEAYQHWVRKFQGFVRSKSPGKVDAEDVKAFLTHLAVEQGVAASTQNQAFNALLFFFRHVLRQEFGELTGVARAKRRPYVPVVLSRKEVDLVLEELEPPYRLVTSLLYGCGLRISECLSLRVHCINMESKLLTVHDGKGLKDRSVPLPAKLEEALWGQLEEVKVLYKKDLERGTAGVFLPKQLERKYRRAPKQFTWQWLFPAPSLTRVPESGEWKRYHLHEAHVQAAVKSAAERAGITKRVSPHTFRHTFASHLLLAGYDLPTIQRLLGHSDVKTTMIYLQTVPPVKVKEAISPLDL